MGRWRAPTSRSTRRHFPAFPCEARWVDGARRPRALPGVTSPRSSAKRDGSLRRRFMTQALRRRDPSRFVNLIAESLRYLRMRRSWRLAPLRDWDDARCQNDATGTPASVACEHLRWLL